MRKSSLAERSAGAAASLHTRIRSDIERKIRAGDWRPGHRIPFEHELMRQYDCSRMTVSRAVSELVSSGLVVRRRRAGSFVAAPPSNSTILDIPDIAADLQRRGAAYSYRLIRRSLRQAYRSKPEERDLAGDGRVLALVCLHEENGQPFALERRLIGVEAVPGAASADFAKASPGSWLLDHVPWTQAEHRISAIAADPATAKLLNIASGAPCLQLERRTWRDGQPVTHVWQTFPGDRHQLVGSFQPTARRSPA